MNNEFNKQIVKERQSYYWYMLSLVLMLISGLAILVTIYLAFYPFRTTDYLNVPFPTDKKVYNVGETIGFTVEYCKSELEPVDVVRELTSDTTLITLPNIKSNFPVGCPKTLFVKRTEIPEYLPSGTYKLVLTVQFKVNPLQTQTKVIETEPFEIVGGDDLE